MYNLSFFLTGVIDKSYRGMIYIVLFNRGSEPYFIRNGDRITQLIIERVTNTILLETELGSTFRETQGLVPSGMNSCLVQFNTKTNETPVLDLSFLDSVSTFIS